MSSGTRIRRSYAVCPITVCSSPESNGNSSGSTRPLRVRICFCAYRHETQGRGILGVHSRFASLHGLRLLRLDPDRRSTPLVAGEADAPRRPQAARRTPVAPAGRERRRRCHERHSGCEPAKGGASGSATRTPQDGAAALRRLFRLSQRHRTSAPDRAYATQVEARYVVAFRDTAACAERRFGSGTPMWGATNRGRVEVRSSSGSVAWGCCCEGPATLRARSRFGVRRVFPGQRPV